MLTHSVAGVTTGVSIYISVGDRECFLVKKTTAHPPRHTISVAMVIYKNTFWQMFNKLEKSLTICSEIQGEYLK